MDPIWVYGRLVGIIRLALLGTCWRIQCFQIFERYTSLSGIDSRLALRESCGLGGCAFLTFSQLSGVMVSGGNKTLL